MLDIAGIVKHDGIPTSKFFPYYILELQAQDTCGLKQTNPANKQTNPANK